jgi:DNA-binding transcriptional ArsR family regulator
VLRIHLTAEDLLRIRYASQPAPLIDLGSALLALKRPSPVLRSWSHRTIGGLPRTARFLLDLIPASGTFPIFLDPISNGLSEGLEKVQRTPSAQVKNELQRVFPAGPPAPWTALLTTRDQTTWGELDKAMRQAHRHIFRDAWTRLSRSFQAELAWRGQLIAELGAQDALSALHPAISWNGTVLQIKAVTEWDFYPDGAGLTLLPSVTWTGRPTVTNHPDGSTTIVYPALTPLPLIDAAACDPLSDLLGRTRAEVFRAALAGHTTTELSRELGISLATVSGHTKTLRAAGLIGTVRDGKAVRHLTTPLGVRLLATGSTCEPGLTGRGA